MGRLYAFLVGYYSGVEAYLIYTCIAIGKQKEGVFVYKFIQTKPMFWCEIAALFTTFGVCGLAFRLL